MNLNEWRGFVLHFTTKQWQKRTANLIITLAVLDAAVRHESYRFHSGHSNSRCRFNHHNYAAIIFHYGKCSTLTHELVIRFD